MSWTPADSGIKVTPEMEKALETASTEQIKEIFRDAAIKQHLVVPDIYNPQVLLPVEPGMQPRSFAKSVTVNGVKHILEGATETELLQNETALYRRLFSEPASAGTEQPRDPATGQFRATAEQNNNSATQVERDAELRARILRGDATNDDLVEHYLQSRGIDPAALQKITTQAYQENWNAAVQDFLASSDWPGSEANMRRLGDKLIEMGATDKPSVETLQRAYAELKKNNQLVENEEVAREKKIASARTPEELREALGYQGNMLWGR